MDQSPRSAALGKGRGKTQRRPRKPKPGSGNVTPAAIGQPGMQMPQNPAMNQPQQANMGMPMQGVQVRFLQKKNKRKYCLIVKCFVLFCFVFV